ncbi:hypothetical protein J6590_025249 [Homalodisca vitripennis]|nr:hypothetical protein J6590_025249 [Homalodisca vitripennis]
MEYSAVGAMLLMSLLVGVYYTFFNKQKTFVDSMMSGKTMGRFPITMSLVAISSMVFQLMKSFPQKDTCIGFSKLARQVFVNSRISFQKCGK